MRNKAFRAIITFTAILSFAGLLSCGRKDVHRSIAVQEVTGNVTATGVEKNGQLVKGEHLVSGDGIDVAAESDLTICADNTKFLYADPLTRFHIETAEAETSNIRIVMDSGTTLHHLTEKLNTGDTYEVDTPNSTMAARGTKFRVTVYRDEVGDSFTLLEVYEGKVFVRLRTELGELTGEEATLQPGDYAVIYGNTEISEFVINKTTKLDSEGKIYWDFDQNSTSDDGTTALIGLLTELDEDFEYDPDPSTMVVVGQESGTSVLIGPSGVSTSSGTGDKNETGSSASSSTSSESTTSTSNVGSSASTSKSETSTSTSKAGTSTSTSKTETSASTSTSASKSTASASASQSTASASASQSTASASASQSTASASASASNSVVPSTGTPSASSEKPEPEPEHVHTPGDWQISIAPNCTNAGQRVRKCTGCGQVVQTETVAAYGHNAGSWQVITEPSCEKEGVKIQKCTVCSAEVAREAVPAKGHTLGQWITTKAATCEQAGVRVRKCTVCNTEIESEVVAASGHSSGEWKVVKAADCTHDGEREKVCRVCGKTTVTETVKALGHDMQVRTEVAANCTTDGYKILKCSRCSEEKREANGKALGHHLVKDASKSTEANCVEHGMDVMVCHRNNSPDKLAGNPYSVQVYIPETGHKYIDNWIVTRDATCQSTGEKVRACVNAGCHFGPNGGAETQTETIPVDPNKHVWSDTRTKIVQDFEHGSNLMDNHDEISDYECTLCHTAKGDTAVTKALADAHTWVSGMNDPNSIYQYSTCQHGTLYYYHCSVCHEYKPDDYEDDGMLGQCVWTGPVWDGTCWTKTCSECHTVEYNNNPQSNTPDLWTDNWSSVHP